MAGDDAHGTLKLVRRSDCWYCCYNPSLLIVCSIEFRPHAPHPLLRKYVCIQYVYTILHQTNRLARRGTRSRCRWKLQNYPTSSLRPWAKRTMTRNAWQWKYHYRTSKLWCWQKWLNIARIIRKLSQVSSAAIHHSCYACIYCRLVILHFVRGNI